MSFLIFTGSDNLLSFTFPPSSHLTRAESLVTLHLHHSTAELYSTNLTAKYARLKMVLEKHQYLVTDSGRC